MTPGVPVGDLCAQTRGQWAKVARFYIVLCCDPRFVPADLELELEAKLDLALSVRALRLRDGRTSGHVDEASAAAPSTGSEVRKAKVWMVEDIEKLGSECEFESFS